MRKPHELDEPVKRRAALGLLGGFVGTLVTAPAWHSHTVLDVELNVAAYYYEVIKRRGIGKPLPGVVALDIELANLDDVDVEPMFTSWDHRRKTRHRWEVESGPDVLDAGERADYRLEVPSDEAAILAGYRAQLTVWQLDEELWRSFHLTPPGREP